MEKRYRWTHKKPLARSNPIPLVDGLPVPGPQSQTSFIKEGEVFQPTPEELASFGDRIEKIWGEEATK